MGVQRKRDGGRRVISHEQEGNGPLDSRAKVMIFDKKYGLIYVLEIYQSPMCQTSFLKPSILQSGFSKS